MKASDLLFLTVLLSLPVQLNKFFWPQFSFVFGIPQDLLAISVYLSDVLILFYILVFAAEFIFKKGAKDRLADFYKRQKIFILAAIAFNLYLFVNALFISDRPILSLWFSSKVFEFSLLATFAQFTLSKNKVFKLSFTVLAISIFWQSCLIFLQLIFQRSLGLWFLGERSFSADTPSIAHVYIFGKQLLRPYGTFPHPNVAAAFFAVGFIILSARKGSKITKLNIFASALSLLSVFLTFSKGAAAAIFAGLVFMVKKPFYLTLVLLLSVFSAFIFFKNLPEGQVVSIAERLILSQAAVELIFKNPLFGVGSANFLHALSAFNLFSIADVRLLAPVHNVFLLIFAEEGLIGLFLFLFLLWAALKNISARWQFALAFALIVFLTVDHFLWTLQQGRFLFWLSLAYILRFSKGHIA